VPLLNPDFSFVIERRRLFVESFQTAPETLPHALPFHFCKYCVASILVTEDNPVTTVLQVALPFVITKPLSIALV
jgi:hypothetical protein